MKFWDIVDSQDHITEEAIKNSTAKLIAPGAILVVIRSGVLKHSFPIGINKVPVAINQDLKALTCSERVDATYLARFLQSNARNLLTNVRGTTADNIPTESLRQIQVPLPPLSEQKRIAEILDRAESLRRQRRAALALLDELTQSIFLDMFGDPVSNPKGWAICTLADVLSIPLRNGLSPSKSGKVLANVLTLSAITGISFNPTATKESTFVSKPPANQSVDQSDFLICRGNGNLKLVGRGFFPGSSMPDTTFPDTMIAARVDTQISQRFLELIWNSRAVRNQIVASARTTNGTYKVNQTMLEAVSFICPPFELQNQFSNRIEVITQQKTFFQSSLNQLDRLFASLQHRAFRGEL